MQGASFIKLNNKLTVESINGRSIPIRKTPVSGPIDADDRLIVNCNTDPSLSTTNTRAEKHKNDISTKERKKKFECLLLNHVITVEPDNLKPD